MKTLLIPFLAVLSLTACSTASVEETKPVIEQADKKPEPVTAGPAADAAKAADPAVTLKPSEAPASVPEKSGTVEAKSEADVKLKTADGKIIDAPAPKTEIANKDSKGGETATASSAATHDHAEAGVEPAKALQWLKNGNRRFVKNYLRNDGQSMKDVKRLADGQKPHTIVLSCSDSRVPPELVFDQKLGEIFVVRTAGESLDSMALASIEYAYQHLGARHLLVLGHSSCGAVKAAYSTLKGGDAGSPWLNQLVADIQPRIRAISGPAPSEQFLAEGWANVKGVARDLPQRSNILKEAVETNKLEISQGLYHLDSGEVEWQ